MLGAIGGRKFLLTLIVIAVGTAVQILSPTGVNEAFVALLVGVSAAYGASNAVITSKALANEAKPDSTSAATIDVSPVVYEVEQLKSQIAVLQEGTEAQMQALANIQQGAALTQQLLKAALTVSK